VSLNQVYDRLKQELNKVIFGQDDVINLALAAFFSSGHVLLEGVPGTAKTLLVRSVASALHLDFGRIQMTPDLLPGDVTGSTIFNETQRTFDFVPGPVFKNFLLADELNRASARTQSALLEAMQELQVTYGGKSYPLPEPFIVFATQNPVEQEGTYPLPIAQLDRFMFKIIVGYPEAKAEQDILRKHHGTAGKSNPADIGVQPVVSGDEIIAARQTIRDTFVRDEVIEYVQSLVQATRDDENLSVGASPRAGLMLLMAAKSIARFGGRDYVTPDDVKSVLIPTMRHRVILSPMAEMEGLLVDNILENLMDMVEVPR